MALCVCMGRRCGCDVRADAEQDGDDPVIDEDGGEGERYEDGEVVPGCRDRPAG